MNNKKYKFDKKYISKLQKIKKIQLGFKFNKSEKYFEIPLNHRGFKVNQLTKIGKDSGLHKLEKLNFDSIEIQQNHLHRPRIENINLANQIRNIDIQFLKGIYLVKNFNLINH